MEARLNLFGSPLVAKALKHVASASMMIIKDSTLPSATRDLVLLRASQINGCGYCTDVHSKDLGHGGESATRVNLVAAWREATVFTEAERAALELTEQGTRIADAAGGVTDEAWSIAAEHYNEEELATLVLLIALINANNRLGSSPGCPAATTSPASSDTEEEPSRPPEPAAQPAPGPFTGALSCARRQPGPGRRYGFLQFSLMAGGSGNEDRRGDGARRRPGRRGCAAGRSDDRRAAEWAGLHGVAVVSRAEERAEERAGEFQELRSLLFSIAYRILGSVSEAEDAVQDTWLRYEASSTRPRSAKAYLSATVTRISIDVLRSARVRREAYAGPWFPEPLLTDPYQDPERSAELADSMSMAALLLLERLSPLERAVFVLREVFAFSFREIASAVERSEAACRQLAMQARRHMDAGRPRFEADRTERDKLAGRFFAAFKRGDVDGLRDLLAADVLMVGDGGGKAPQLAHPVVGHENVAQALATVFAPLARIGVVVEPHEVNGHPGAIFRDRDGQVLNIWTLDILDGRVQAIRTVINPDKLGHVGPVADAWEIAREADEARLPTD